MGTYSGFWRVANQSWTMQRAMAFDFGSDSMVWRIADQFMYGDSLLVAPIVSNESSRNVYLPHVPGGWTGFYSGATTTALPATVTVQPDIREIPLFVRAGSILLLGPDQQYTGESKSDPIEIRIFPGTDGSFVLFEDDGTSGASDQYSTIAFEWQDDTRTLTIGARAGEGFQGMLRTRTFLVFLVSPGHGVGVAPAASNKADKTVVYDGSMLAVH